MQTFIKKIVAFAASVVLTLVVLEIVIRHSLMLPIIWNTNIFPPLGFVSNPGKRVNTGLIRWTEVRRFGLVSESITLGSTTGGITEKRRAPTHFAWLSSAIRSSKPSKWTSTVRFRAYSKDVFWGKKSKPRSTASAFRGTAPPRYSTFSTALY